MISEVWFQGVRKIVRSKINLCDEGDSLDPKTYKQLTKRFSEWDKRGKLRVESKEDIAARGIKSPDRADGLLGCIMCGSHMTGALTAESVEGSVVPKSEFGSGGGEVLGW